MKDNYSAIWRKELQDMMIARGLNPRELEEEVYMRQPDGYKRYDKFLQTHYPDLWVQFQAYMRLIGKD